MVNKTATFSILLSIVRGIVENRDELEALAAVRITVTWTKTWLSGYTLFCGDRKHPIHTGGLTLCVCGGIFAHLQGTR